jgi:hypothetical protein
MLWQYSNLICMSSVGLALICTGCAFIAYTINAGRAVDDPKKRNYPLLAVFLTPFTLPLSILFLALALFLFVLRALLFALFLAIFIPSLILLQKPEEPLLIERMAAKIGEPLLKINTRLLKLAFEPWVRRPKPA